MKTDKLLVVVAAALSFLAWASCSASAANHSISFSTGMNPTR